jgi:hypothetical protein
MVPTQLPLTAQRTTTKVSHKQLRWRSRRQRRRTQKARDPCTHNPDPRSKAARSHWIGFGPHQVSSEPPVTRTWERKCRDLGIGLLLMPVQSLVKQCACAVRRTVLTIPCTRSFPCTPRIRRSRMSGREKIAPTANICSSKCYIYYVPGPTCRGSDLCACPPSAIKGEACDVTTQAQSGGLRHVWFVAKCATLCLRLVIQIE